MILDQQVEVGGSDVSSYVSSIERRHCVCDTMATGTVSLVYTCPTSLNPYDTIVIHEQGTKVFTGYVASISREKLAGLINIQFTDPSIRLQDYWITQGYTANGETVQYWIQFFCDLAGVTCTFNTTLPELVPAPEDPTAYNWEFSSAMSIIQELMTTNGYWMYSDVDGVIHFTQGFVSTASVTLQAGDNILRASRERSTTPARNRAIVFGRYNRFSEATTVVPALGDAEKTVVIASPNLVLQSSINALATKLASAFGEVSDEKILTVLGDPDIQIPKFAHVVDSWLDVDVTEQITEVQSRMNNNGYTMELRINQKCPRVWGLTDFLAASMVAYNNLAGCRVLESYSWDVRNGILSGEDIWDNHGNVDYAKSSESTKVFWKVDGSNIFNSIDSGETWTDVAPTSVENFKLDEPAPTIADITFTQVITDPNNADRAYITGTWTHSNGFHRVVLIKTWDFGETWEWSYICSTLMLTGAGGKIELTKPYWVGKGDGAIFRDPTTSESRVVYSLAIDTDAGPIAGRSLDDPVTELKYLANTSDNGYCVANVDWVLPDGLYIRDTTGATVISIVARAVNENPLVANSRAMFYRSLTQGLNVASGWSAATAPWSNLDQNVYCTANSTYAYEAGPLFRVASGVGPPETFNSIRYTFEPNWETYPKWAATGQIGRIQKIIIEGFDALVFPDGTIPLAMDIDKHEGDFLYLTVYEEIFHTIYLFKISTDPLAIALSVAVGTSYLNGGVPDWNAFSQMYPRTPPAQVDDKNTCYIYGRTFEHDSIPRYVEQYVNYSQTVLEQGWASGYYCSALQVGYDGVINAVKASGIGGELYRGETSLAFVATLPGAPFLDAFAIQPYTGSGYKLAVGIETASGIPAVYEAEDLFTNWTDITINYPAYGDVTALYYLE